jgi:hypothetical protein
MGSSDPRTSAHRPVRRGQRRRQRQRRPVDNDFDGETGSTFPFTFSDSTGIWDAGFYAVIQS